MVRSDKLLKRSSHGVVTWDVDRDLSTVYYGVDCSRVTICI